MGRKEVVEEIKLTESKVRGRIEGARRKKAETLEEARARARRFEEDSDLKARGECSAMLAAAREAVERERRAIVEKGKADADVLRKKASVQKAKELFVLKFEEYIK